ncbi:hypothetical protein [Cryobacterium mannosilyticum]|uniref:HNH endonuclease n=1 Tax=Cryobacterium mannosilyticum TaxID=1259190 RepID=A0A4R8W3X6_9MICO|nr:hypothetical protein [Cryobacterium mannosilyticum]TFC01211.1 hypothetical protein E3O32_13700 [Cryobacterium mannosilyticum]
MTEPNQQSWSAPEAEVSGQERLISLERQLALIDRVIGLEAQVAELAIADSLTPSAELAAQRQLALMRQSSAWRMGRLVTAPIRVAQRIVRRGRSA